ARIGPLGGTAASLVGPRPSWITHAATLTSLLDRGVCTRRTRFLDRVAAESPVEDGWHQAHHRGGDDDPEPGADKGAGLRAGATAQMVTRIRPGTISSMSPTVVATA